jgi:hypothetical protein
MTYLGGYSLACTTLIFSQTVTKTEVGIRRGTDATMLGASPRLF